MKVRQVHDMGCAVATIASLLARPYRAVLRDCWGETPPRDGQRLAIGLTAHEIAAALRRQYGLRARVEHPWRLPPRPSILLFDWTPEDLCSGYHSVVYCPGRRPHVIDPACAFGLPVEFYLPRWHQSGRETVVIGPYARSR